MEIQEHNTLTNQISIRNATNEEIATFRADKLQSELEQTELIKILTARTAAQAKLAALGLTTDDLKALGLGGN